MKTRKWNYDKIYLEAQKYNRRIDFRNGSYGAYQAAQRMAILDEVCCHMEPSKTEPYSDEELQIEANKYLNRGSFAKQSPKHYSSAHKRGILDHICKSMPSERYSDEELRMEASKFLTRGNFENDNPAAYLAVCRKGKAFYEAAFSHMKSPINEAYTLEELQIEANKYLTRGSFALGSSGAYGAALKRNILDKICSHMKILKGVSLAEKELFNIIKEIYPSAKKFRDRKVKIEGRSHIKSFELDILIDDKAIEYDGTYWHSIDGLRKSRKNWPDIDLINYHKIKDDWFATKGIKILHIKEEDWMSDKNICISKCLDFLSKNIDLCSQ